MNTNTHTTQQDSQAGDEQITYGIDMSEPGGDMTALSIKRGNMVYTFVGDEAEVILAYAERRATLRAIEARMDEWERLAWDDNVSDEIKDALQPYYKARHDELRRELTASLQTGDIDE
jgi:hypothetical protein